MAHRKDAVICLDWNDPELKRAWRAFDDPVEAHPISGETWQHICSVRDNRQGWMHCFRHRHHPRSNQRELRQIAASPDWAPSIEVES